MNALRIVLPGLVTRALSAPDSAPLRWLLSPLRPVSSIYGWGMRIRTRLYARGWLKQRSLPLQVISVGNLTVGGTGKTPVVIALANGLRARGRRVGVVSRGYGRRRVGTVREVSDGETVTGDPLDTGDEPWLIARRCPGVPVVVGANRYQAGQHLRRRFGINTLVLDDGFQHLALRRNVDVLILDATAPFGNGHVLPRGPLREGVSAMDRADLVLLTRARLAGDLSALKTRIRTVAPEKPIAVIDFVPAAVVTLGNARDEDPAVLKGARVVAMSGIGNPNSFHSLLLSLGATVLDDHIFPDHHLYSATDLERVGQAAREAGADWIVTTEKDLVKLGRLRVRNAARVPVSAVRIDLEWVEGYDAWERIVLHG